jgi:peptidoglycan/LPS O-acetylase OafA/YrhL
MTRVVAAAIIFVLMLAVLVLYLNPDATDQNFAWTIKPRMMAMAIGAGYLMGAYFFARVLTARRWHRVAAGFLPITAFTIGMALATILHWDRFHAGQWPALAWASVYALTPFLVPVIWRLNQRTDPRVPEANDVVVPKAVRRLGAIAGASMVVGGVLAFVQPELVIRVWPWSLTPLTARVLAGWFMLPAVGGLYLALEPRWSGWRILIETVTVFCAFFLIAAVVSWSDWSQTSMQTWGLLLAMVLVLLLGPALYAYFELRRQRIAVSRT